MAKVEEDRSFELQQKRWTELIDLRQAMMDHGMDPSGVELAISNVFDPKKGRMVDSMISDGKELIAMIIQLEELHIDSSNVKLALRKAFIPGMSGAYDVGLLKLKGMIKMREQMAGMGIFTGCIEATIAEVFQVSLVDNEIEDIANRPSHCRLLQRLSSLKKFPRFLLNSHVQQHQRPSSPQSSMPLLPLSSSD